MILLVTSLVIILTCCDKIISKHKTQAVITNYTLTNLDLYSNPFHVPYKPHRRYQNEIEDLRSSALLSYKAKIV